MKTITEIDEDGIWQEWILKSKYKALAKVSDMQEKEIEELEHKNELLDSSNRLKAQDVINKAQEIKELKDEANKQEKLAKHWYDKFFELRARTESKL